MSKPQVLGSRIDRQALGVFSATRSERERHGTTGVGMFIRRRCAKCNQFRATSGGKTKGRFVCKECLG